ncbi:MAG: thiamine phosphate synthase [Cytophagaceae bacterium]|nr:thiamine phosphate synthase [Cytophagaceae bacterium]
MKGLIFITHQNERFNYLQSVAIALGGGCRLIQLRMKDVSDNIVLQTALQAKEMCDRHNAQLFIDDRVEICKTVGAAGVHLGRHDMSPADARALLGTGFIIGGTANTLDDIVALNRQRVDYIGLGPFRFTATKKNLSPVLGIAGYRNIMQQCCENNLRLPVFAIGGITANDVPDLINAGVSGVAISSAILNADDPIEAVKKFNV